MSNHPYVRLQAEPPWTTENAGRLIELAKEEAKRRGTFLILLDLRSWEQPDSEMVRYDSGVRVAELLNAPYRVAAVSNKESVNYFAENVAVNRGASLKMFADEASALNWLLK